MAILEGEALSGLKVLVAVAKADGTISPVEEEQLRDALEALPVPGGESPKPLLDELTRDPVDPEKEARSIRDAGAREATWNAAYTLAWADGEPTEAEKRVLERVRIGLEIPEDRATLLGRIYREAADTVLPSNINPVSDPAERAKEIREDTQKYAVMSAVLGFFPVPFVMDVAVVGLQVKLVRDIGQYWGHKVDGPAAKSLLYGLGLGTGARLAVLGLARLVPGFGSVVGAAGSYASTWALGRVADQFFAGGGKADVKTLKESFRTAEKEGREEYRKKKAAVEAKKKETSVRIEELNADLKAGRITQPEYERQVDELA
jgi:uncharacterized protein (DUF697 family)/tellurite resistance protein